VKLPSASSLLSGGLLVWAMLSRTSLQVNVYMGPATLNGASTKGAPSLVDWIFPFLAGMLVLYLVLRVLRLLRHEPVPAPVPARPEPADGKADGPACEVTLSMAEDLLLKYCLKERVPDAAVKMRTFMRWEKGETVPKAGYSRRCRETLSAFGEWVKAYVIDYKANTAVSRAFVQFNEDIHSKGRKER